MTRNQLRALIEQVAAWPDQAQAELLRSMVQIEAKYGSVYRVDDEEHAALERSADDVQHARYARGEAIEEVFGRFRRA